MTHDDQDQVTGSHDNIVFVASHDVGDEVFDRFYLDVLRPAFPPEELDDIDTVRAAYLRPVRGCHGTIALRRGEPVGGALGEYHEPSGIMLLGYVAIRSDMRGRGFGGALLRATLSTWRALVESIAILAEIEHPAFHQTSVYGDPQARLRFYDQLGSKLLPLPYFQPSLGPGLARVRGMLLICLDPATDTVPGEAVRHFLDDYITNYEGDRVREADPEYRALRACAEDWPDDEIPLWPLSRAAEVFATEM
jgi:GNAT superfamily N-acetyltransferase